MLDIRGLYKVKPHVRVSDLNLLIKPGEIVSFECNQDMSQLLFSLILTKESPAGGIILIDGQESSLCIRKMRKHVGVVSEAEGLYERMTVKEYLKFFSELVDSQKHYQDLMQKLGLLDMSEQKITSLSLAQKKRLSFARESLKDMKLLLFQDPLTGMDNNHLRMVLEHIESLRKRGAAIFCTSVSFKQALLIGGQVYSLDEDGLVLIEHEKDDAVASPQDQVQAREGDNDTTDSVLKQWTNSSSMKIEKIPARLDENILLFNPIEIDFIESEKSVSYLSIKGDRFVCPLTLNALESRLEHLGFFRCHRSYLVNLQRVREIVTWTRNSFSLVLDDKNKSTLPLSKGRIEAMKRFLNL